MTVPNNRVCSICGDKHEAKGLCKTHYMEARYAANPGLFKAKQAAYRAANPGKNKEACAAQYAAKKDKYLARQAAYDALHPEEKKARHKAWVAANREKVRAYHLEYQRAYRAEDPERERERNRKWRKANLHKDCAKVARRNAAKLKATPKWANHFFIREIYHLARLRTKMLGYRWEVDHIVPLRSKVVCGLHCEANLRVLPESANRSKSNHAWPDMP